MGKIFKALKKAEKESKPTQQSSADQEQPGVRQAGTPSTNMPDVGRDHRPPRSDRTRHAIMPAEATGVEKPIMHPYNRPADEIPPLQAETVAPPIDRSSTPRLDERPASDDTHPAIDTPQRPVKTESVQEPDAIRKPDSVNIALVKPEDIESSLAVQQLDHEPETGITYAAASRSGDASFKKEVKVRYSRTKVQVSDPKKLRNNKVLAIFEDMETTNQFKILRTQVLRKLKACGGNSILVTSANQYEGKTFTSINLGVSIAKEFDRTVLIIDADNRRPTREHTDFSTEFFSLEVKKGLTDYLVGDADIEDILINPGIDKLTLIPGGTPVDNSPELLNSARMEMMMSEIKSRYPSDRLVIVDGPAILHFPDAMILYRYVDGVLPVVEVEKTSGEDLKKMMNLLKDVNVLGVVMNKNKG